MRHNSALCALALGAALTGSSGCSLVLVHGPPAGHESLAAFSCTRNNVAPIVDAVFAGTGLFVGATLMRAGSSEWTVPYAVVGAGMALEGLVWAGSAAYGLHKTSRCREALRRLSERRAGAAPVPSP